MSEAEKLRALLAEARERIGYCPCGSGLCEQPADMVRRIDAALAEPVADYDIDADLRMHKEDRLRLRTENLRLTRERDEARAEVERLRSLKPIGTYSLDWNHEQERMTVARAAYQRGAEAMREAAYQAAYRNLIDGDDDVCADTCRAIRTLRIPEDK